MENPYSPVPPIEVVVPKGVGGSEFKEGQIIKTPDHQPDLIIKKVIDPLRALFLGFAADYSKAFVGLVGAGMTPLGSKLLYAGSFWHLLVNCASLAVAGPGFNFITNISLILNELKKRYPLVFGEPK